MKLFIQRKWIDILWLSIRKKLPIYHLNFSFYRLFFFMSLRNFLTGNAMNKFIKSSQCGSRGKGMSRWKKRRLEEWIKICARQERSLNIYYCALLSYDTYIVVIKLSVHKHADKCNKISFYVTQLGLIFIYSTFIKLITS